MFRWTVLLKKRHMLPTGQNDSDRFCFQSSLLARGSYTQLHACWACHLHLGWWAVVLNKSLLFASVLLLMPTAEPGKLAETMPVAWRDLLLSWTSTDAEQSH